jgi:hypothetical protein
MAELNLVTLDASSGSVVKTTMQEEAEKMESLNMDDFLKHETIAFWIHEIENTIKITTLIGYKNNIKRVFKEMPMNPKWVTASKKNAKEYWHNYVTYYRTKTGKKQPSGPVRVAFKSLLSVYDISFAHKEGKKFNLGSEHDSYKKYAGVSLVKFVPKLKQMMIENKDYESLLWFMTGLRTSARGGALATMSWDRIYFDNLDTDGQPFFKIEIHETKVPKGHYHLAEDGNWFDYYPNDELKQYFQEWKKTHPLFRRFVWFEDTGSDVGNRKKAVLQHARMAKTLATYYKQIESEFDPLLAEYVKKRPDHVMCHTFAQMCKNDGMSNEEIKESGHWTDEQSVSWYCATEESKIKSIKRRSSELNF